MSSKEDIKNFILEMKGKYGNLPKFCHSTKEFNKKVLYSGFYWDDEEVIECINSLLFENWAISGPSVTRFEEEYAKLVKNKYAVMTNSGSSANLIMVAAVKRVLGWKDNSEILVAAASFPTTVSVIPQNNLKAILVDIEMDSLNIDINQLESKITNKTVGLMIAPCLGNPPNYKKLKELCEKYNIVILNDLCDSIGGTFEENDLTSYGIANTCSLFASHHISVINGGMISTDNYEIANTARKMTKWYRDCYCSGLFATKKDGQCGHRFDSWLKTHPDKITDHRYIFGGMGYNLQNLSMCGAIGLAQLKKWDEIHLKRRENKEKIESLFKKYLKNISFPVVDPKANPSWFGVGIICQNNEYRSKLVNYLENNGINTRSYFSGNIACHPEFSELADWRLFPNSNKVLELVFFVGCAPFYTDEHINHIEAVLSSFQE